ncbi:MAG: phosphate-starvation-inducible PsiE family protein [Methylophilaceae bacterium]|nr:phosphate-starvation-inducible PsiE family protein [Methylophilaceae bacterium]
MDRSILKKWLQAWAQQNQDIFAPSLTFYQRIESTVALILTVMVTLVVFVAVYRLSVDVMGKLLLGAANPLDHKVFQSVFGQIMTVLIALEFNHTLQYVVSREQSIIQIKTVLLIALMAVARKFIVLDLAEISADHLLGLAAITFVLGITYWLVRERDDRRLQG